MKTFVLLAILIGAAFLYESGEFPAWVERLRTVWATQAPSLDDNLEAPKPSRDCGAAVDRANARSESLKASLREMSSALQQCGGWLAECEGRCPMSPVGKQNSDGGK